MSDSYSAIPRWYDPMEFWDLSGLPWNMADEGHRHKLHKYMRLYYQTHTLIPLLVDIFTRFPLSGMNITCKDPKLADFYEDVFLNHLDYENLLTFLGKEYWTVGEAFPFASFDESLGIWEYEEFANPENIVIENFPLLGTSQMKLVPPDHMKKLAQTRQPAQEYHLLETKFPEWIPYLLRGEPVPVSPVLLKQIAFKVTPWDDHGTPILLRALRTLIHEEKLHASQDAVAERLFSPMIIAKLGFQEAGDLGAWLPTPADLEDLRDQFDMALASDFRLLVHHYGLQVDTVFGRESVPDLSNDFDRIDRKLMQCVSGKTRVHTEDGVRFAEELAGQTVDVLSLGGLYRSAQWSSYGRQRIYEIELENGDVLEATDGHQWLITQKNGKHKRITTLELEGESLPIQFNATSFEYDESEWQKGVQHGMVYGDGWLYMDGKYSMLRQHGDSQHLIEDHFDLVRRHKINHTSSGTATAATKLSADYKKLPFIYESPSYLRGFIAGFIATDGNVDDTGRVVICQSNKAALEWVRELAIYAGLPTLGVVETTYPNPKRKQRAYKLGFVKAGFFTDEGLDERLVLKNKHRLYMRATSHKRQRYSMRVVAVRPTDSIEEVYCCVEPETHTFVIENHYVTGNCFGINPSLLSAGANSQPYASSALQAEFMNQILRTFQKYLKKHFYDRASVVAEVNEHYDYEMRGQTKVPIMERVIEVGEDGVKRYVEKPKLLVPELEMEVLDMRDEATQRNYMLQLRSIGVPIPDNRLMIGFNFDFDEGLHELNDEMVKKTITSAQGQSKAFEALEVQGLPVPQDLAQAMGTMASESGGGPTGPSAGPGGSIAMPEPPAGLGAGASGGGMTPHARPEDFRGPVPEVSNERRQNLNYGQGGRPLSHQSMLNDLPSYHKWLASNDELPPPIPRVEVDDEFRDSEVLLGEEAEGRDSSELEGIDQGSGGEIRHSD